MATRPFAFGLRFREKGRTVRVRTQPNQPRRYVLEDGHERRKTRKREHTSLSAALEDFASTWRGRLH